MPLHLVDWPLVLLVVSWVALFGAAQLGFWARRRIGPMSDAQHEEVGLTLSSLITLLALIIGFSFSMAVGRYDMRKHDEAAEANTLGTEYLRVAMLDPQTSVALRGLLRQYGQLRIAWYLERDGDELAKLDERTTMVQTRMWEQVQQAARREQTPVRSLVASGMNEVIDARGYAEAAWLDRIPRAAWMLLLIIGLSVTLMMGYDTRTSGWHSAIFAAIIATSFCLIADLDSTRRGFINNTPVNIVSTVAGMRD